MKLIVMVGTLALYVLALLVCLGPEQGGRYPAHLLVLIILSSFGCWLLTAKR